MKKILIAFLLLGYSSMAHADTWTLVSTNAMGSVEMGKWWLSYDPSNGAPFVAARNRFIDPDGHMSFFIDYVPIKDCEAGAGTILTADVHGNVFGNHDFVYGGGDVSSTIAETLCALAIRQP